MALKPVPISHAPSALQQTLDLASAKTAPEALPVEILHNLRFQHRWTNVQILKHPPSKDDVPPLRLVDRSPSRAPRHMSPTLLCGVPPKSLYIHPNYQSYLLQQDSSVETLQPEVEYVFPLTLGQSFSLRLLQAAFDSIPPRAPIHANNGFRHQDAKRILLAMRGPQGMGGDGTVNYYIVQEGEVKPRQN